jgi:hypothetical protein
MMGLGGSGQSVPFLVGDPIFMARVGDGFQLDLSSECNLLIYLEGDPGIEPGTFGSGDQRSIH